MRFPEPLPCGKVPLSAQGLSKSYGSLEVFTGVDLAIDRGSKVVVLGLNGAGKTTLLRLLARVEEPDSGIVEDGHGLKLGYYAQEHDTLDMNATVKENMAHSAPGFDDTHVRNVLGQFLFSGDDVDKPTHVLSGGEKTRLARRNSARAPFLRGCRSFGYPRSGCSDSPCPRARTGSSRCR